MSDTPNLHRGGTRQSSIELLRIIAMLAIVAGHSVVHAGQNHPPLSANGFFAVGLTQGSRIGVDLFIFISGFFSVGRALNIKKLILQYIQIWSYSVLIIFGLYLSGHIDLGFKSAVRALLPVSSSVYWFATSYFLIMLASPFLQAAVAAVDEHKYRFVLLVFFFFWCVLPTTYIASPGFNEFTWLVYVYLFGAYLRKYPVKILENVKAWHGAACYLCIVTLAILTYCFGQGSIFLRENAIYLYGEMNKIPTVLCMLLLFFGFKNMHLPDNRFISLLAPLTFGIYLFHDNPYLRKYIWIETLGASLDDPMYILKKAGSVLLVFMIGAGIEYIRRSITERLEDKTRLIEKADEFFRSY